MKKLTLFITGIILSLSAYAVNFYNCAAPSGLNASVNTDGTTCGSTLATWNAANTNTLFVRAASAFNLTADLTLVANMDLVATNSTVTSSANNRILTVGNGATLYVSGIIDFSSRQNCQIIVASGGTLIVYPTGQILNNGANSNSTITIEAGGTAIIDGTVSSTGNVTIDGSVSGSGSIISGSGSVVVNGNIMFEDNYKVSTSVITGTGTITVKRNFSNTTTGGWVRMGFPVLSGTVGNLVTAGFSLTYTGGGTNIYTWNASNSTYGAVSASTPLNGNAFFIYIGTSGTGRSISTPAVTTANFNNTTHAQNLSYHNGVGGNFVSAVIDGWNQLYNPFQSFIDWNLVAPSLTPAAGFQQSAVYVWDGSAYQTWNTGGSGAAQWIAPHQAFFVQVATSTPASFSFTNAMRTTSQGTPVPTFKNSGNGGKNLVLAVNGSGAKATTEIVLNSSASASFDGAFDAYWLEGATTTPKFYTVDLNGTQYSLNQSANHLSSSIPLAFSHPTNGATFSISIDPQSNWTKGRVVFIKDLLTNQTKQLSVKKPYTFTNSTSAPTNRFIISFAVNSLFKAVGVDEDEIETAATWFVNDDLKIKTLVPITNATVKVYNVAGQIVAQNTFKTLLEETIPVEGAGGIFVVHISAEDGTEVTAKAVKF